MDDRPADVAFLGGEVYTVDAARSWAQAVAVRDERIVAVGADHDVRAHVGPRTEVVDLRGRLLLPGFQDAHVHPMSGGLQRLRCGLDDLDDADAYLGRIARYATNHPEVEWILGGGWSMPAFAGGTPRKEPLDGAVNDRPVFLPNRDGHGAWVNSRALEIAGIDSGTPDPPDGRIERDPDGSPSGTLHEGAMALVARHVPEATVEDGRRALLIAQQHLHSLGITAWQDANLDGHRAEPDARPIYTALDEAGELTARVVGALWWERDRGVEQIPDLLARRATASRFRATTVKLMQDGVCENRTAAVLEPYLDGSGRRTDERGLSFIDPAVLADAVRTLDRERVQCHIHAIGERAVREALDAIAAAREANGWSDNRHHLAHIQVIHPDDLARFRAVGAIANAQALWAAHEPQMDELTIPILGPERSAWQYPFGSLHHSGAQLALGSDWPVSSPNPLEQIHVAVNRTVPSAVGTPVEPFLPAERLDLATSVAAFTIGSAYVNHLEADTGSVEVGKLADLAVLDRNVFAESPQDIGSARVLLTTVGGTPVFAADDL